MLSSSAPALSRRLVASIERVFLGWMAAGASQGPYRAALGAACSLFNTVPDRQGRCLCSLSHGGPDVHGQQMPSSVSTMPAIPYACTRAPEASGAQLAEEAFLTRTACRRGGAAGASTHEHRAQVAWACTGARPAPHRRLGEGPLCRSR